ncbi:M24 family metallopeptidase [Desulfocurvus sp. DL9XJH121]
MLTAIETLSRQELELRWARCRSMLDTLAPGAGGLLVFSRVALYYLTGHVGNGMFWLPLAGEPVLLCRRGLERARLESSVSAILPYRSYKDVRGILAEAGSPMGAVAAVEMNALTWPMGQKLAGDLGDVKLVPGDMALSMARAKKTPWELARMRECGARHHKALHDLLPRRIRPGMSERDVAVVLWEIFFSLGHTGIIRMSGGGENFMGPVSAGESANYPHVFDGPVGLRGAHPSTPFMGDAGTVWQQGQPLICDVGFAYNGYVTDKTQVFWAGAEAAIPDEARRAHDFCKRVQDRLAGLMVPGAVPDELYAEVMADPEARELAKGFMSLGGNKVFFLGHGIGLVMDEFPVIAARVRTPLEEGMVIALEPKYGVEGLGMVGVENTFEITVHGAVSITGREDGIVCI